MNKSSKPTLEENNMLNQTTRHTREAIRAIHEDLNDQDRVDLIKVLVKELKSRACVGYVTLRHEGDHLAIKVWFEPEPADPVFSVDIPYDGGYVPVLVDGISDTINFDEGGVQSDDM